MTKKRLLVHMGLPKTGTTYLQESVFPKLGGIQYLGKLEAPLLQGASGPLYGIVDRSFKQSVAIWDDHGDEIFSKYIGPASELKGGLHGALISDEGIGTAGRRPEHLALHLTKLADYASKWGYESIRVICVVRRQDQWFGSHYAQMSDREPLASQDHFEAFVRDALDPWQRYYQDGVLLDYKGLWNTLCRVLGEDNVLMVPFELFRDDPEAYLTQIVGFITGTEVGGKELASLSIDVRRTLDIQYNQRSTGVDQWALRPRREQGDPTLSARALQRLRRMLPPRWRATGQAEIGRITMTPELKRAIFDVYREGNDALAYDLDLDLAQYGYC